MKKLFIGGVILAVLIVIVLVIVIAAGGSYNRLVSRSQAVDKQWAQVENVYQRRADLVPNLVATVSGAANFEKSTLTEVTEARASVGKVTVNPGTAPTDPAQLAEFEKAQGSLSSALSRLLVVSEQYPDLKATAGFRDLQAQLEGTENRISVERGRFNDVVQDYNTAIKSFPDNLYAGAFGFKEKPYFTATAGADKPPQVQFDFNNKPATTPAPANP
jgi:LemA protein